MGLENTDTINGLDASNPADGDPIKQGDNHIRMIKTVLKNTFPNFTGSVNISDTDLNGFFNVLNYGSGDGYHWAAQALNVLQDSSATTHDLNKLHNVTTGWGDLNKLDGFTGNTNDLNRLPGISGGRILTTGDNGHNGRIDANTLDGQHGDYYLNVNNMKSGQLNSTRLKMVKSAGQARDRNEDIRLMTPKRVRQAFQADDNIPMFAVRAFGKIWEAGTLASGGNVAWVNRNSQGTYRIGFHHRMPNSHYTVVVTSHDARYDTSATIYRQDRNAFEVRLSDDDNEQAMNHFHFVVVC